MPAGGDGGAAEARAGGGVKRALLGFGAALPIGWVGGLIGLGGAEFRLPLLAGPLKYSPRQAVPLNLAISLVTLGAALAARGRALPLDRLADLLPAILALIAGAMLAAFWGAAWASRVSNAVLRRIILILLLAIGLALIVEAFLPREAPGFVPRAPLWQAAAGALFGLGIGVFSSVLGVAGGELIIPTLVFAFGADIKLAGTASLLISLPTVAVGIVRFAGRGAYAQRRDLTETVAPMGLGSVIGALIGGLMAGLAPTDALKVILGLILIYSAWRIFE
jgi:uncharacterized membrane protein YfcA